MSNLEEKPNQEDKQVVSIHMDQLELPEEMSKKISLDLLQWMVTEDLSASVLNMTATRRIHVIQKLRKRKKKAYTIVGGFVPFVMLMKKGWEGEVKCVIQTEHRGANYLLGGLYHELFGLKAGPVASAAKSVLLKQFVDWEASSCCPTGISISSRSLNNSTGLVKGFTGYDSRAFVRAKKEGIPIEIVDLIARNLGLDKSSENAPVASNDDLQEKCDD